MLSVREERERAKRFLLKTPMPKYVAPYHALFTDPGGHLWAVTSAPGDAVTELQSVHPDGRPLATVRLPGEVTVYEVGEDYILGAYEDPHGEQHVAVYEMRPAR